MSEHNKDFNSWNDQKIITHFNKKNIYFKEREVWWCKLGINVGVEIDGKEDLFIRPVIILRKFNEHMAVVIPTTTKNKIGRYYFHVETKSQNSYIGCISQIRTISSRRLLRKIDQIEDLSYVNLLNETLKMLSGYLYKTKPPQRGGISEPEGHNESIILNQ